jgi:hypothetical protein
MERNSNAAKQSCNRGHLENAKTRGCEKILAAEKGEVLGREMRP